MECYVVPGLKEAVALAVKNYNWRPVRTLLEGTLPKDSVEYRQLQQIDVNDNLIEEACSSGFTELVSIYLKNGFPANYTVNKSFVERMLHLAASKGFLSLVKLLLNVGADIDCKAHDGKLPLFYAVQEGHLEVVKHLITAGADINTCDKDCETLLDAALHYNTVKEEIVQLLLDSGCDPNNIKCMKMLLDAGANVSGTGTHIPLHYAAYHGFIPIMELLLDYAADINARSTGGYTALHVAVRGEELQSVEFLIEHCSLINSLTNDQQTPLSLSIYHRQFSTAILLINSGADLNLHIHDTVLHTAVTQSAPVELIEFLLEHGASVTALHNNTTALQCFISYSNYSNNEKLQISKLLLIYGSDHYVEDIYGNTLLHWACKMGDMGLAEYLIYYGLNVDAKNRKGKKPYDIAREKGHTNIVKAIIHYHCNKYTKF